MSDTLDVLTLSEAKRAINLADANTSQDTELAAYVTAVSRRLDDLCGPIVVRTVTEQHDDPSGSVVFLREPPASAITSVTEYSTGVATVLAAETLTSQTDSDYRFDPTLGVVTRRAGWANATFGAQAVVVVYQAGRYASTAAVDAKFKQGAAIMLAHLWRKEQGAGTVTFSEAQFDGTLTPSFAVPKAVLELLEAELRAPAVA